MAIKVHIDRMLVEREMSVTELSERVGITMANISILKMVRLKQYASLHLKHFAKHSTVNLKISLNIEKINKCKEASPLPFIDSFNF